MRESTKTNDRALSLQLFLTLLLTGLRGAHSAGSRELTREDSFALSADLVLSAVEKRTRLVIVNTPHNPTGAVMATQELVTLAEALAAREIPLVIDEVLHPLYFDAPLTEAVGVAALAASRALLSRLESVARTNLAMFERFVRAHRTSIGWVRPSGGTVSFPWLLDGSNARPMCEALVSVPANQRAYRLTSIDMLRGLVIVIMAIDHTRDYFSVAMSIDPMNDPSASLLLAFTRWITHFCAPVFVFLAGTSAGLMVARKSPADLCKFLLTRGLWLIFVEIFIISTAATFAPGGIEQLGGKTLAFMQVIWAIGASMVVLAFAQFLGRKVCLVLGALIVLGHNALDGHWPVSQHLMDTSPPLWAALHVSMSKVAGPFHFLFLYPLLPWLGVMFLGFGASVLFEREPAARNRALLLWGLGITALFMVLRFIDGYGEPNHWQVQARGAATFIDFLNTTKYPPSLLFLAMTLGPAAVLCAFADRMRGFLKDTLVMFGRVPFAFYVPHFFVLHLFSLALGALQGVPVAQLLTFPPFYPRGYGVSLPAVYGIWLLVIVLLYPLCRWMAEVKARSRAWWLSYA